MRGTWSEGRKYCLGKCPWAPCQQGYHTGSSEIDHYSQGSTLLSFQHGREVATSCAFAGQPQCPLLLESCVMEATWWEVDLKEKD